jgi:phosphatidylinositol alpha-1,6-mannosyltransferase
MILGLFTGVMATGGIERLSRHTAAVLTTFAQTCDLPCTILSLNDPSGHHAMQVAEVPFTLRGFGRQKSTFILSALAAASRGSVVYIGHSNLAPIGLLMKAMRPSLEYWVATYGIDVWAPLSPLWRLALRAASGVTTISRYTAKMLIEMQQLSCSKITLIPPALDPGFASSDGTNAVIAFPSPASPILLTVARLAASERYKGIDTVIQALPKVLTALPDTQYVIVGDGDDRPRLEGLARAVGVAEHVFFAGVQGSDELIKCYEACDVFVMPSRAEGFGIVFLEAMAFGKPVIGCNCGGTPDVIRDGVTGFLVRYGDIPDLASRVLSLLQNKSLRQQMGQTGRQYVEENFSFAQLQSRLVHLLTGGMEMTDRTLTCSEGSETGR